MLRLRSTRPALAVGAVAAMLTTGLDASAQTVIEADYQVFLGGLRVVEIEARTEIAPGGYSIESLGRSSGLLDTLFSFESRSTASGRIVNGEIIPERFQVRGIVRDEVRELDLEHRDGAPPSLRIDPPIDPEERDPVPEHLQVDIVDPLSAIVHASLSWRNSTPCDDTIPVFNGRARTNITLAPAGKERLKKSRHSSFEGEAYVCEVSFETLAGGFKKPWFGKDRKADPIKLWIAKLDGTDFWTPVRMAGDAVIGTAFVHLTDVSISTLRAETDQTVVIDERHAGKQM